METSTIHISDDSLAVLEAKARTEKKTVDELAEEALRAVLQEPSWEELLAYGRERARLAGVSEEQSGDIVRNWRQEQSRR